jgi:MFS transporter, AAHS family, benzoate transport protein
MNQTIQYKRGGTVVTKIDIQTLIDQANLSRFHRGLLFWCTLIAVFDGYDLVIYGTVLPSLMLKWGITPLQAGALGSYAVIGLACGGFIAGLLGDQYGRKRTIILCVMVYSVATALTGFSANLSEFGVCRFIAGLGIGGVMPTVVVLVVEYSPKRMQSMLVALISSGFALGGILSAGLGMLMIRRFGWESLFFVGIVPVFLLPLILKNLPESLGFKLRQGKKFECQAILQKLVPSYLPAQDDQLEMPDFNKASRTSVSILFNNGKAFSTMMLWVSFALNLLMFYGINSWLPKLMVNAGYEIRSSLASMLVLYIGGICGALSGAWLADRTKLKHVLIVFFGISAVALSALGLKPNICVLYLLMFAAGATSLGTLILAYAFAAQLYPPAGRSTGVGWATAVGRMGAIFGPILGGYLLDLRLTYQHNFFAFAIPGALAAVAVALISTGGLQGMPKDIAPETAPPSA